MQINAADEPQEDVILEEDTEDVNKDAVLPELSETNTVATEENDVVVLEESAVVSPAPVLTTSTPEAGSECSSSTQAFIHAGNLSPCSFPFHVDLLFYLFVTLSHENLLRWPHQSMHPSTMRKT